MSLWRKKIEDLVSMGKDMAQEGHFDAKNILTTSQSFKDRYVLYISIDFEAKILKRNCIAHETYIFKNESNSGAPQWGFPAPPPTAAIFLFQMVKNTILNEKSEFNSKISVQSTPVSTKNQKTFFLRDINQKFFFLPYGFHILASQKNNFHGHGGSQWVPGCLLAHFRAIKGFF